MRIVTELPGHYFCVHHVNMTEDEKILLKDFEENVVSIIGHYAIKLEDSNKFGEHTDAVIDLFYDVLLSVSTLQFGHDTLEECDEAIQNYRVRHDKWIDARPYQSKKLIH